MKPIILAAFSLFLSHLAGAQALHGIVTDDRGHGISGATVVAQASYQATSTDSAGRFTLAAVPLKDSIVLLVSALGFEGNRVRLTSDSLKNEIRIILRTKNSELKEVIISAGTFEASDGKRITILKPFDLATVPASPPDEFKAIGELPGTTKVGESEGLFVRGGDASETRAVIDGMIVQDPFFSSVPGIAQNSRFSAFLFKGTAFSTGGYSAQYGGALSSVLELNTQDLAQASSESIVLSTVGITANVTQTWDHTSLIVNAKYVDLRPSFAFNKQNYTYTSAPQNEGGDLIFRNLDKSGGLFKFYGSYGQTSVNLQIPYLSSNPGDAFYDLHNQNIYTNSTYKLTLGSWVMNAGASFSHNDDHIVFDTSNVVKKNSRLQGRLVFSHYIGVRSKFIVGAEGQDAAFSNNLNLSHYSLNEGLFSSFAETEFYIGNKIAARAGVRDEFSNTIDRANIAPRVSVAYVIDSHNQFSFAYGNFYQLPQETYLYTNKTLSFEEATHYILDYQYTRNGRTFRVECYYKNYGQLVKEPDSTAFESFNIDRIPPSNTTSTGYGFARGIDVFWYDKKTFTNFNYWIAYSYLDTRRLFENYPVEAMPTFAAKHNVSVVMKYNVPSTSLNLGLTYNYTSGRPYYDPLHPFLSDRTPPVNNLIFAGNYSWFVKSNLIAIFIYTDNVLGIHNIYNYYYSPDGSQRYTLTPPAYRSIYAGISLTLAKRRTIMGINF